MNKCRRCKQYKDESQFTKNNKEQLSFYCIECQGKADEIVAQRNKRHMKRSWINSTYRQVKDDGC